MIFTKILQKMLEQDLTLYILKQTGHYIKEKKVIVLMKDELGEQIMNEFLGLRAKTYSYLKDNNDDKKVKGRKKCVIKKLKF